MTSQHSSTEHPTQRIDPLLVMVLGQSTRPSQVNGSQQAKSFWTQLVHGVSPDPAILAIPTPQLMFSDRQVSVGLIGLQHSARSQ
jgi:hypothetical protein